MGDRYTGGCIRLSVLILWREFQGWSRIVAALEGMGILCFFERLTELGKEISPVEISFRILFEFLTKGKKLIKIEILL